MQEKPIEERAESEHDELLQALSDGEHRISDELVTSCDAAAAARSRWHKAGSAVRMAVAMHSDADGALLREEAGFATHDEAELTDAMREVRDTALEEYAELAGAPATDAQRAFLTSTTLRHYVDPPKVKHLVNALARRGKQKALLRGDDVYLAGSLRVVGFDKDGSSILSWETATQRASFASYIPQFEYMFWTALDLNRPGATGVIVISSYTNGYFNPLQFMNPAPVLALAEMVEGQYRRRLKAGIMVGMPRAFDWLFKLLLKAVKEETRNKLAICKDEEEVIELLRSTHGVDEATLERYRASLQNRLDHRKAPKAHALRWSPLIEHPFFEAALADLGLDAQTDRITPAVHARLRRAVHEFRLQHWGALTQRVPAMISALANRLSRVVGGLFGAAE